MSINAKNLVVGETYEIIQRGATKAIGEFTGKREGILGNPIMKVGDSEMGFSAARYSFKKAVKGGKRSRRNRRNRKQTRRRR